MDMSHKEEEFWIKRNKKEETEFFARIMDGLHDTLSELEPEITKVANMKPEQRNADQKQFFAHHQAILLGLQFLDDQKLDFDQKYEVASKIREHLSDMELL